MSAGEPIVCGKCRVCGCSELNPCVDESSGLSCTWVDDAHTLCDNIQCLAQIPLVELERILGWSRGD